MNILPKKSWHVRTRKNIERVKRDEAEAERLSNIEKDRVLRAEQEARMKELRLRAGVPEERSSTHINLFENYKEAQQTSNPEHDAEERKREAASRLRAEIPGSLVRPGDVSTPWYCSSKSDRPGIELSKSEKISSIYDPMTAIRHAEQIVREKRARLSGAGSSLSCVSAIKDPRTEQDSSPEIICEIKGAKVQKIRKHSSQETRRNESRVHRKRSMKFEKHYDSKKFKSRATHKEF